MAAIGTTVSTLVDITRELDPSGKSLDVAMLLAQRNEMIQDIPWVEANGLTGHVMAQQTSEPSVSWRTFNGFAEHGGTSGISRRTKFGDSDQGVSRQGGKDGFFR